MSRSNLRVVADTNLIVSAMLAEGTPPQQTMDYVAKQGTLLLSTGTFSELAEVLLRPRFERYMPIETRLNLLAKIEKEGEWVTITHRIFVCRDDRDN